MKLSLSGLALQFTNSVLLGDSCKISPLASYFYQSLGSYLMYLLVDETLTFPALSVLPLRSFEAFLLVSGGVGFGFL